MYTKAKIYNLALGILLLQRQISDPETSQTNEAKVLNTWWDVAYESSLIEMDLDATSTPVTLELLDTDPNDKWGRVYKYPEKCVFLRRIESLMLVDNRDTHIPKRVGTWENKRAIFTNEIEAVAECVMKDLPLSVLSIHAGMTVAAKLASLSAPLIVGKGASRLQKIADEKFVVSKALAQAHDRLENFNFDDPEEESDFVRARLE